MAVGDIWQLTLYGQIQGQTTVNVLHYRQEATGGLADTANALLDQGENVIVPLWRVCQSKEFGWIKATAQRIAPSPPSVQYARAIVNVGLVDADSLPSEVAAVLQKKTDFGGRRFRGRNFLAGIPVGVLVQTTGRFDGAYQLDLDAAAETFVDPVEVPAASVLLAPIIYDRVLTTGTLITSYGADDVPRAQRRRQPGRGV